MGEILTYKDRIVIPGSLRQEALEIFHGVHQGVTAMTAIASQSIFWPGMSEAIIFFFIFVHYIFTEVSYGH